MSKPISLCDEATFSQVFDEYAISLHNYLFYKTGNKNLAQDLTQEAFVKLWQNCKKVIFATAKGYVFKTAKNLMLNQISHQKVVLAFEQRSTNNINIQDPEFIIEEKEFQRQLEQAISELPEKQRVVFLMSRIDKKTYKEIASLLGISKQAVEKRMYNALNSLRKVSKLIP